MRIGIIGLGNIGKSILNGLLRTSECHSIFLFDPNRDKVQGLCSSHSYRVSIGCLEKEVELVFVCVRQENLDQCLEMYASVLKHTTHAVFTQVTESLESLKAKAPLKDALVIRAIPNGNVSCNRGHIVVLHPEGSLIPQGPRSILKSLGRLVSVKTEAELLTKSVVIGCAPTLILSLLQAMDDSISAYNTEDPEIADLLLESILQTILHIQLEKKSPSSLKESLLSPNGFAKKMLIHLEYKESLTFAGQNWIPDLISHYQTNIPNLR